MTKSEKRQTGGFPGYCNARKQSQLADNASSSSKMESGATMEGSYEKSEWSELRLN